MNLSNYLNDCPDNYAHRFADYVAVARDEMGGDSAPAFGPGWVEWAATQPDVPDLLAEFEEPKGLE